MKPLVINREIQLIQQPELYVVAVVKWNEDDSHLLQRVYDNFDAAALYALTLWKIERQIWLDELLDYTTYNGTLGDRYADEFADKVFPYDSDQFFGMDFQVLVDAELTDPDGDTLSEWNWDMEHKLTTGYRVSKLKWNQDKEYWQ